MKTKIAIAGDHQQFVGALSSVLSLFSFDILYTASHGAELIGKIRQLRPLPDVCIIDFRMPVMGGLETLNIIQSNWPFIKIVVYTMEDSVHLRDTCFEAGASGFVLKDADMEELAGTINACTKTLN